MHLRATRVLIAVTAVAAAVRLAAPLRADERPLPDVQRFLRETRQHLRTDRELLSQYTYLQRSADLRLSPLGKLSTGPVKVYQVYPGAGPVDTYRKLIEVDGRPVPAAEQEKQDRERQRAVLDLLAKRERESAADAAKRTAQREKRLRDREQMFDDLFRVYDFRIVGREAASGHSAIVIDFAPKPASSPVTDEGKMMRKVKGRAWISEDDYQVARVEAQMLDDVAYAGFLFKLYEGTTASFERRKVNNEVWLPSEMRINGSGRALIRKFRIDTVVQYSDYKKFTVDTGTEFTLQKK